MSRIIVITGAGDGLGRALARRFAADGDRLILLGRTATKLDAVVAELGAPHMAVPCDVADPDSVRAAFRTIAGHYQRIDLLINNAAVYQPFALGDAPDDQIVGQLMTNFAGPIFCAREALPLLRGGGHIINVSSESVALRMPMLGLYAGAKAGLEYMSESWARELEADGVRVTVVRAGQMMDETKTGVNWPADVAIRFAQENARVGLNLRERPLSHYNNVTDAFRAIIDMPADLHVGMVALSARRD